MTKYGFSFCVPLALAAVACTHAPDETLGQASAELSQAARVRLPASVALHAKSSDCDNANASVSLDGTLSLGGANARFWFSNNAKGTHTTSADMSVTGVSIAGASALSIPKSPHKGGVGGNPYIWVQLVDGQGNALTDELFMGRCHQLSPVAAATLVDAAISLDVVGTSCSGKGGSAVTVGASGAIAYPGMSARIIFRSANEKWAVSAESSSDLAIMLGSSFAIPKQPVLGGSGGNPYVSFQLFDEAWQPLTQPSTPRRCSEL